MLALSSDPKARSPRTSRITLCFIYLFSPQSDLFLCRAIFGPLCPPGLSGLLKQQSYHPKMATLCEILFRIRYGGVHFWDYYKFLDVHFRDSAKPASFDSGPASDPAGRSSSAKRRTSCQRARRSATARELAMCKCSACRARGRKTPAKTSLTNQAQTRLMGLGGNQ